MAWSAHLDHIAPGSIQRLTLTVPAGFEFAAGQYLEVLHSNGSKIPLSIGSSPATLPTLHLYYKPTPGDPMATAMDELLEADYLAVSDAQGSVLCPRATTPLLIVAAGSGVSQALSCTAWHGGNTTVLWCIDSQEDFEAIQHDIEHSPATWIVRVDNRITADNLGMTWLRDNAQAFMNAAIIIAGAPGFVYAVTDLLLDLGLSTEQLQSDVYQYAPR